MNLVNGETIKITNPSPIVLFVYNRLWHTRKTIGALKKNKLADQSDLIIYSDGPKNDDDRSKVIEIRDYLRTVDGFNSLMIIERKKNFGLAANIVEGVTEIVKRYGKIIVMEDDIVTSPSYLLFMNQALEFYNKEPNIWHISGWNYPIEVNGLGDAFFWRVMNCWGWATWEDRWKYFEKDEDKLLKEFTQDDIKRFNIDNSENFWNQVIQNKKNVINTWAIFWYATIFKNNGLCLNPALTMVENIGNDLSGMNSIKTYNFDSNLSVNYKINFPMIVIESEISVKRLVKFYKKVNSKYYSLVKKIKAFVK